MPVPQNRVGMGWKTGRVATGRRIGSTQRNINASVRSFESWLRELPTPDRRKIHRIEPEKLDLYLAEFYKVVKKSSGEDYSPFSLGVYRSCLSKYLSAHGYPHSILRSDLFVRSTNAFKQRKLELRLNGPTVLPPRWHDDESDICEAAACKP